MSAFLRRAAAALMAHSRSTTATATTTATTAITTRAARAMSLINTPSTRKHTTDATSTTTHDNDEAENVHNNNTWMNALDARYFENDVVWVSPVSIKRGPQWLRKPAGYPPQGWKMTSLVDAWRQKRSEKEEWKEIEQTLVSKNEVPLLKLGATEPVGTAELYSDVFRYKLRKDLLARVVRYQRNAIRQGTARAKNRAEVAGSGRKVRAQKGSGRARIGDIRPPHLRGGGQAHPPRPRDYSIDLPKKVRAFALQVALSARYDEGRLHVMENPVFEKASTKEATARLEVHNWRKPLFVVGDDVDENFLASITNIQMINLISVLNINVFDILAHPHVILTPRAVEQLHYRFMIPPYIRQWE